MKSLNIVFLEPKKVELVEQAVSPPGDGEVLCETRRSLIGIGTETTCLYGEFDPDTNWYEWVKYPFKPGYSIAARVIETGKGVTALKPGDRVASDETHMQFFNSPEKNLIKLSDSLTDEQAVWIPLCRVAQNIVRKCEVRMGDSVVVIGAGQVGQLVINFARICGATQIISIDPVKSRSVISLKSGATHTLSLRADEAAEPLYDLTGSAMADVVIDSTGNPAVLSAACKLARDYGKIGLVGDTSVPSKQYLGPGVVNRNLTILGAHGTMTAAYDNPFYPWTMKRTNLTSIALIEQGKLLVDLLITNRYSPAECAKVYMKLLEDRTCGMGHIFEWDRLREASILGT